MRGSSWGYGVALGMVVAGGVMLSDSLSREFALPLQAYLYLFLSSLALPTLAEGLFVGGRGAAFTLAEVRDMWRPPEAAPVQTVQTDDEPDAAPGVDEALEREWHTALERFFRAGEKAGGFSIRKLEGVVGSPTWARLTAFYCTAVGENVLRLAAGDEGTVWGRGWTLDDVIRRLERGDFPRPPGDVPTVELYIAPQRTTQRRTTAKTPLPSVIEGVFKE